MDNDSNIGLQSGIVILQQHQPSWHQAFEVEKLRLQQVLGTNMAIEHVGSTAVAGLGAKPILDIAIAIDSLTNVDPFIEPLAGLGYKYEAEAGVPGRRFFVKGPKDKQTVHLHFGKLDGEFGSLVAFRDLLRGDPRLVKKYNQLKQELAKKFASDRKAYTSGKSDFIQKILQGKEPG